nr:AbrB/MazE/SpoVT family DNA-binding domain-containing protein [Dictyoglomus thermophilum]
MTDKTVLTQKSQITIPQKIREFLNLKPGDQVEFVIENDIVKLVPIHSKLDECFGRVKPKRKLEYYKK